MVRDGVPFVVVPALLGVAGGVVSIWAPLVWIATVVFFVLAAFMAYFFRDPDRSIPLQPGIVVSPADGRVTTVQQAQSPSGESRVSIFLSPFDVHINRAPIEGEVADITYRKGKFMMATKDEASLLNEQNSLTIVGKDMTVKCTQIAGILARRIVCWKRRGERVKCGERFGMIKFGSRTDLWLPSNIDILVNEGMHVRGGETIIGKIKS